MSFDLLGYAIYRQYYRPNKYTIYSSTLTNGQLSPSQYAIKQSYQSRSNVAGVYLINFASSSQIQQSVIFNIHVPGDTTTYTFTAKTREAYSNGNYYWYGDLTGVSGIVVDTLLPTGSLSLVGSSSKLFGEMRIDTKHYGLPSLSGNLNALVIYDQPTSEVGEPTCISAGGGPVDTTTQSGERAPCPVVDVLIVYTQAAKNEFPDVEDIGKQAFQNAKQALLNSEVYPEQVDLHLKGVVLLPGFTANAWPSDTVGMLSPNSTLQQLRNTYHADLVFILTPSVYPQFTGAVFDFGDLPVDGVRAFAFVEVASANLPTYTLTHELGHLFGGRHQWADDCETNDDPSGLQEAHAHSWQKGHFWWLRFYKTVTSACYDNGQRVTILNFSNPDVDYSSRSTGVPGWANNAKTIRNAVCRISNYVNSNDINVFTDQPINYVCPGYSFGFRGFAVGDFGPYQFSWKYKLGSGGSWINYTPSGSPDVFNFVVPANFYGTIYVELTATNGTDVGTASTYAYSDYLKCPHYRQSSERTAQSFEKIAAMSIIPNPARDMIEVQLAEPARGIMEVVVTNTLGKTYLSQTIASGDAETGRFSLNLPEAPSGVYLLNVKRVGMPTQVQEFMIIR